MRFLEAQVQINITKNPKTLCKTSEAKQNAEMARYALQWRTQLIQCLSQLISDCNDLESLMRLRQDPVDSVARASGFV